MLTGNEWFETVLIRSFSSKTGPRTFDTKAQPKQDPQNQL